jgi:Ser/Thr protein kinase RdoA (MazF antagonist)
MVEIREDAAVSSILRLLSSRYGLRSESLARLPTGQGTINYRAAASDFAAFVKRYPPGSDLLREREGIRLSELARQQGIPAAPIIRNLDGDVIDETGPTPISVWFWMPGSVQTDGLSEIQYEQIGAALGKIHCLFAALPASRSLARRSKTWLEISVTNLESTIQQLQSIVAERIRHGAADAFDRAAVQQLSERKSMVSRIPELLQGLPTLTSQVIHGDYSLVNIMFESGRLTAVLDFRPPDPFFIAYELGRVAFQPNIVVNNPDWIEAARVLVRAYIDQNPSVAATDVRACGRVALLQLLRSLYGIKQHYMDSGLLQDDLDAFWSVRHETVSRLLANLPLMDEMLSAFSTGRA